VQGKSTVIDECSKLDAYLAGELSLADSRSFAHHIESCDLCNQAIDQQRWIDGLLRFPLVKDLEPAPDDLRSTLSVSLIRRRRHAQIAACGLAAAAVLTIAAGWTMLLNRQSATTTVPDASGVLHADAERLRDPAATFVGGPDMIVVPIESRLPDVTIVRVYAAYQPSYTAQANVDPAADPFDWPDDPTEVSHELPKPN
jgi:hypothetical protein